MANRYKFSRRDSVRGGKRSLKTMSREERVRRARKAAYAKSLRKLLGIPPK